MARRFSTCQMVVINLIINTNVININFINSIVIVTIIIIITTSWQTGSTWLTATGLARTR